MRFGMPKIEIEHNDILGRPIAVGDCVAFSSYNNMAIATVIKLTPKMVKVKEIGINATWYTGNNKYPKDLVILNGPDVIMYILQKKS
jgi:hypothetical protein